MTSTPFLLLRFIAGSSKCTTKDLSCLLTKVLSTIKDGLVRYCNTKTSRNGVNNGRLIFQHFTPQSHMIY